MNQSQEDEVARFGFRDIAVVVLSMFVLAALAAQSIFKLDSDVATLLDRIDFFICIFFLVDFGIRLKEARSKRQYLKWGWIDLISSIPVWDPLRWGRALRVIRILRALRAFRSGRHLLRLLYRNKAKATIATAALAVTVLILVSAVAVLSVEKDSGSAIKSPFDAFWWAVTTVTTVGYGDMVPLTVEGKVVAMILMVAGIALFGVFTGLFARLLIDSGEDDMERNAVLRELQILREKIEALGPINKSSPAIVDASLNPQPLRSEAQPAESEDRRAQG